MGPDFNKQRILAHEKYLKENQQKRESDPIFAECEDMVQAGQCPSWKFRAEWSCMVIKKGKCEYLQNPKAHICMQCWRLALTKPNHIELPLVTNSRSKDLRFR